MSRDDPCTCCWFACPGVVHTEGQHHECAVHIPDPIPEMFPGTLAALDALTIRKATP